MDLNFIFWVLLLLSLLNITRYISSLRVLLFIMRDSDPYLYLQVDGRGFFRSTGILSKQMRLFHYLREQRYTSHHDERFIEKCVQVRQQFVLSSALLLLTLVVCLLEWWVPVLTH